MNNARELGDGKGKATSESAQRVRMQAYLRLFVACKWQSQTVFVVAAAVVVDQRTGQRWRLGPEMPKRGGGW